MKIVAALAALLAAGLAPQDPALHKDKVVLRTSKGVLVLVLYPDVAPRHVEHFLQLVRSGFYNGTRFIRINPRFLVQHGGAQDRLRPLTAEQAALGDVRLPAEFGSLKHVRGALSMSRHPDDLNSGQSCFTIQLAEAPHLDGKYTIFGRVESGFDVLDALAATEVGPDYQPKLPVNVHAAYVVGEKPWAPPEEQGPGDLVVVGAAAIGIGLAAFLLAGRVLPRAAGPIGLAIVISGFFVGFVGAVPWVIRTQSKVLALAIFISLLALFKLMNRFESPRP